MLVSACLSIAADLLRTAGERTSKHIPTCLKNLCAATPAFKANEPGRPMFEGKPNLWMLHALRSIQSLLERESAGASVVERHC